MIKTTWRKEIIFTIGRESLETLEDINYGEHGISIYLSKSVNYFIPYCSIAMIKSIDVGD